jgi:IS30 family transposase
VYDVQNDLAAEAHRQRPVPSKPRKPRASLSRSDIATLPFRRQGGETLRNIAADLGVSHVTIYRALKRTAHA